MGLFLEWVARRELTESTGEVYQCLGAQIGPDGVTLTIVSPDGRKGPTSPVRHMKAMNQPSPDGGKLYQAATQNSVYTLSMDDQTAQTVLKTFFHFKDSPHGKALEKQRADRALGIRGGATFGGSQQRGAKFVLGTGDTAKPNA